MTKSVYGKEKEKNGVEEDKQKHQFKLQWQDFRPQQDGEHVETQDIEEGHEEEALLNNQNNSRIDVDDDELEDLLNELNDAEDQVAPRHDSLDDDDDDLVGGNHHVLDDDGEEEGDEFWNREGKGKAPGRNQEIEKRRQELKQTLGDDDFDEFADDLL